LECFAAKKGFLQNKQIFAEENDQKIDQNLFYSRNFVLITFFGVSRFSARGVRNIFQNNDPGPF
jgi:hypothetical protein